MAQRRKVGNPLALAVLAWLMLEPMHPYELARRLEESEQDRSVNYNRGSLYMVVKQLTKAGFIAELETVRDTQRPERTVYALTDPGRAELHDWLGELVARPRDEYPHFGVALSLLSVLPPHRAVELLDARSAALAERLADVRGRVRGATDQGVEWVFLVEEHYRVAQLETESRFVAELIEGLKQPDYVRRWQEMFGSRT
ncbi:PadR family transcriptional regulator [Actinomadura sp. CNU-125]|uniref:PadR family transcriptional regulator n=1 Tax=Actinomadura sp. CNU-125 TaxID=1904961 RepID=UPI000969B9B3|nr:PadR family transcriptional regulator [Actinomadura sp. CNU-125]OLT32572.1 PadR family transcriptional regulator [Actinomadura sp. CNU-125]